MKKYFINFLVLLAAISANAEDILSIVPFQTTAGVAYKENKTIEISLTNTFDVANLQFDILLPEGMALSANNSVFTERAQTYDEEEDDYVNDFTWSSNLLDTGFTRIVFTPTTLNPIKAGAGTILKIRYKSVVSMAAGIYPIVFENIELDKSVTESIKGAQSVSYIVIGDTSPLQTETNVNLSSLTGYMPSFVVEKMNEELAQNEQLVSVNLSGVTEMGATPVVPENVAWFTSNEGGLQRTFTEGYWSTVCMPFALNSEQVGELKATGVEIEVMSDFDEITNEVNFEETEAMEANKPYIVKCPAGATTPFSHFLEVATDGSLSAVPVESGKVTMAGTFEKLTLNSDEEVNYFVFNAADGEFVRVGKNATVPSFRAYIALHSTMVSNRLKVRHHDGIITGIDSVIHSRNLSHITYDLLGRPVAKDKSFGNSIIINNGRKLIGK